MESRVKMIVFRGDANRIRIGATNMTRSDAGLSWRKYEFRSLDIAGHVRCPFFACRLLKLWHEIC